MGDFTKNADRAAVLRMINFRNAVVNLASEYSDLSVGVISNVLSSVSAEAIACAYLPRVTAPQAVKGEV